MLRQISLRLIEEKEMKVAVPYENGEIFQHFGRSSAFKMYEIENGVIVNDAVIGTNGQGHGALAGFLKDNGADILICGGIGAGAKAAMAAAEITLYGGVSGSADDAVAALIAGTLKYNEDIVCDHKDGHGEGHHCEGEHCSHE